MPPTVLLESLQGIRRRVKFLAIGFGTGMVIASAVLLLIVVILIDYVAALPVPARLSLLIAATALLIYACTRWIVRPAISCVSLSDVAGRLEHTFPQFDDRLRSTIDFVRDDLPGSALMKERVVSQATAMASNVDLGRVVLVRPLWYSMAAALGALLLAFLLGILIGRSDLAIAMNRLALGSRPWPKTVQIAVDGDLPQRVPVGQRLPIRIKLTKGDKESRKAVIYYKYDNGPWQQELMSRADGAYSASLDARIDQSKASGQIAIRVEAGDDTKELPAITVVPRLDLARVDADVLPPAYVKPRLGTTVNLSERPAVVAVGSDLSLRMNFNKPLASGRSVELIPAAGQKNPAQIKWDASGNELVAARFQASDSFRFSVRATDQDGFQNAAGEEFEVIVREDQPPTVQIEEPRRSEDRTPDAEFDIKAVAEDDYGIDGAQLVVARLGEKGTSQKNSWVIDLVHDGQAAAIGTTWAPSDSTGERKRFRLDYHWELAKLQNAALKPGDVLEFFIQVKDNFNLNGRQHDWVPSGKLRVTIISHEDWEKKVQEVFEQTFAALKTVDQGQLRNKGETDTLRQGLEQKKKFDEADQTQAERLANQQGGTASQTDQVAQKLGQLQQKMIENKSPEGGMKQTAAEVKKELEETADGPMRDAAQKLNMAEQGKPDLKAPPEQQARDAGERAEAMAKSSGDQQRASDQLRQAMERLGSFGGLTEAIEKIEKILADQKKIGDDFNKKMRDSLGKKPEEMSKSEQENAKKLSDDQKALADQTQKALDDMAKKADQMSKSDPTAADAMKQAAQAGQQQQVSGKQSQAAQSIQQNQQAQAQQQQKQVELGLEDIINKLKEAERRKLEELVTHLEEVQKLIAELIQRQAGHNIDNLLLQGGADRLGKVETAERTELIDFSERDPKTVATDKPQLPSLSASEEQTEKNTRDIAHTAEALPDPAPAAKLTAAAGQMERAAVHLRNSKLIDAYEPPQVQALRNLVDAKKAIDEALKKAQDQLKQDSEETIKQAYVKLLERQHKLGGEIVEIDAAPRGPSGELPRETQVRLGQLPGDQGKISDDAGEIGKKLEKLGSVVYVWANKDIVRSMSDVKDDLAKPATGKPTQLEEQRIEEQLKAMIDNLAQKKKEEQFASRGGGGGGNNSSKTPKMPTEAELRLQKALQQAVNKNTVELDKLAPKDNQKLLALGGRQGELRDVFSQLVQKASGMKLGPEPDNRDQLPEEAKKEDIEDQELEKGLLNDTLTSDEVENHIKLAGDRMARSRQRLALNNDPGQVTQEIQKRIVTDLENMIQLAQQQQSSSQSKPGSGKPGDKTGPPKQGQGSQQASGNPNRQQNSSNPAQTSSNKHDGAPPDLALSKPLEEKRPEWGGITAREREAVQEGASEKVLDKYQKLVKDYYQSLSKEAVQH